MGDKILMSKLYSIAISAILIVSFVIGSGFIAPMSDDSGTLETSIQVNSFALSLVFYITVLAAITLGIASHLYIFEQSQERMLDELHTIARNTSQLRLYESTNPKGKE